MASLQDSLRLKAAGTKPPAMVGAAPLSTPDTPLSEGQSGGIAKSKQVKNAGSTKPVVPKNSPGVDFVTRMGTPSSSDKTVGYF